MLGFAVIDLFAGQLAQYGSFGECLTMQFLILLMYVIVVPILSLPLYTIAVWTEGTADEEELLHSCIDFFAMGASFIIAMMCRGFIMGRVAERHVALDHPPRETALLLATGFVFLVTGLLIVSYMHLNKEEDYFKDLSFVVGIGMKVLVQTLLLTTSWCFLQALEWLWLKQFPHNHVMGRLMIAMSAGVVFVLCIFVLTCVDVKDASIEKTTRPIIQMVSLTVGLSWEKTYDVALEQFVEGASTNEIHRRLIQIFLDLCVVLIFLPGLGLLMMPQNCEELKKSYGDTRFSPWQLFFDLPWDESTEIEHKSEEDLQPHLDDLQPR
jgi:hypothetical protein